MRFFALSLLFALTLAGAAVAQTFTQGILPFHQIMNGAWRIDDPNVVGVLTLQTGASGRLTGTLGAAPCLGQYWAERSSGTVRHRFSVFCADRPRMAYYFAGTVAGAPAIMTGRRSRVTTGAMPEAQTYTDFTATRE
ncbi:MAG: hypothetical protein AB7J28_13610 [Hyphomonadaceae bacterium]